VNDLKTKLSENDAIVKKEEKLSSEVAKRSKDIENLRDDIIKIIEERESFQYIVQKSSKLVKSKDKEINDLKKENA
jgi:phosphate uptake regulator